MAEVEQSGHECVGLTKDGAICGRKLTRFFDELGYRCHHHAEGRWPMREVPEQGGAPLPPRFQPDPPPTEKAPKSMRDIRKLAAWALQQVAMGKMDPEQAKVIAQLCRETRSSLGDEKLKNELDKIKRNQKQIEDRQRKHERADIEEGTD